MKYLLLILKNVRRHPLRAVLTSLGTMVLVCVVTLVWTMLAFFDSLSTEKSKRLQGDRDRPLADSQPDAAELCPYLGGRGGAEARRRAAARTR